MKELVVSDKKTVITDSEEKSASSKNRIGWLKRILPWFGLIVGVVLIAYPFLPGILYVFKNPSSKPLELPYESVISERVGDNETEFVEGEKPIPLDDTLVIPQIGVDVRIVGGDTDAALLEGAWHRPGTGNPVDGGNYVVTGHRFRYLPPNNTTFYNLDKLNKGDLVIVYYDGQEYDYRVEESFVVEPEDLHIEGDLGYDVLTLYTCTPLWTSSKRLVVRALPLE